MNMVIVKGKMRQWRGALRQEWGRLTDDDLDQLVGKSDQWVGLLQERYGYTRERAEHEIDRFLAKYGYGSTSRWEQFQRQLGQVTAQPRFMWGLVVSIVALFAGYLLLRQATTMTEQRAPSRANMSTDTGE